jgi:hypothetical protein
MLYGASGDLAWGEYEDCLRLAGYYFEKLDNIYENRLLGPASAWTARTVREVEKWRSRSH